MRKIIFVVVFAFTTLVSGKPEAPFLDEPLEGPKHYPELLPRVRDLLIYDNPPGSPGSQSSSSAYGVPGGGPNSLGGNSGAPKEIILADPELAPLLSTFDLSPSVEKRTGMGAGGLGFGGGGQSSGFGSNQGRSGGGYN